MTLISNERKCAVCGKRFVMTPGWAYKKSWGKAGKVFCSWKCLRKMETQRKPSAEERKIAIQNALASGLSVNDVSHKLHEDSAKVAYWAKRMGVYPCAENAQTQRSAED